MNRVFVNVLDDRGSIPGRVIPKTQKMLLYAAFFNTQHYKVRLNLSNPGNVVPIENEAFRSPSTRVALLELFFL